MPLSCLRPALLVGLLAGTAACSSEINITAPEPQVIEEITFAPNLGVDLAAMTRTDSGLYYQDFEVGDGPMPTVGDEVRVAYTGSFADGRQLDAGEIIYTIGVASLIDGWEEGLSTMAEGGVRKLVIPPELGYGLNGRPDLGIPGGLVLVFDLELVEVVSPTSP